MDSPSTSNNQDESSSQETSANLPNGVKLEGEECKDIEKKSSKDGFSQQPKEKNIKIKLGNKVYSCQTDGKETILDLIQKKMKKLKSKKNTKNMLLKSSEGYFINLGLPTGVLEEDVEYECIFIPNLKTNIDKMMRDFDVERYDDSWDLKYFYVKFDKDRPRKPNVSSLAQFVGLLQVPFLKGESFVDALTADMRFDQNRKGKQAICMCEFKNEKRVIFSLTDKALQDMVFEFYNSKADPIEASEKKPLPTTSGPSGAALPCVTIKQEPGEDQLEETQAPAIEQSVSSDNSGPLKKVCRWSKEEKLKSIEKAFGLDFQPKKTKDAEDKRMKKINNFCCEKFSLDFKHHILVADMKDLVTDESRCVGATVAVKRNHNNEIVETCAAGTCFRIGKQFVITNEHVLDKIEKRGYQLEYIDFNYTGHTDKKYNYNVTEDAVLLRDESLDYAILKLQETKKILPPNITDFNYQIALPGYNIDEPITLIGHPGGNAKLIDPSCPLKLPSEDPNSKLYIRQQEKDRSHYDVSTFFKGSSGSPGFLLHAKKVVVLHSWGYRVGKSFSFEEGILMSSIVKDVKTKLKKGLVNGGVTLADIFGEGTVKDFEETTPMETDS